MLSEIVQGILDKLKAEGLDVREIGFKDLVDRTINLTRPAVNCTINIGSWQKVTLYTYKCIADVSLIIIFQHLKGGPQGEALRKEGVYKIIEGITQALFLQRLGLDLENPLFPKSFRNITTMEYAKAGYQLYELKMWCSFNTTYSDKDDLGTLTSILAQYYLQPRDYTGMQGVTGPEASDLIGVTGLAP